MDERTVPDLEARTTLGLRQVVKVVVRMKTRTAHRTDGVMKLGREIEITWDGISSCGSSFFLPFPSLFFWFSISSIFLLLLPLRAILSVFAILRSVCVP